MEPIVVKSQLSFKKYYTVNLYILWRRPIIKFLAVLFIVVAIAYAFTGYSEYSDSLRWLFWFYLIYALLLPLLVYRGAASNYKKIRSMSEPKTYEFDATGVKINGETVSATTDWVNIDKVIKRKEDILIFTANNRNFFVLPFTAFSPESDIDALISAIKQKGIKNNFKN